jgi:hypothetical protein
MATGPEKVWTRRRALGLAVAAVAAVAVAVAVVASRPPGAAAAASRPLVSLVRGIEILPEHTQGTFSGYTTGYLTGGWLATVDHTPLQPNATITGGTFTLVTPHGGFDHPLTARFTTGTITNTNSGSNCTNQTFHVNGILAHLDGYRSGRFSVTLTHYRHPILGSCLNYFATVKGNLTLSR